MYRPTLVSQIRRAIELLTLESTLLQVMVTQEVNTLEKNYVIATDTAVTLYKYPPKVYLQGGICPSCAPGFRGRHYIM